MIFKTFNTKQKLHKKANTEFYKYKDELILSEDYQKIYDMNFIENNYENLQRIEHILQTLYTSSLSYVI